jgi:hypothetical protein
MKRRVPGLALAAVLVVGCTFTHQVQRPRTVEQLDPIVSKNRGAITLLYQRSEGATSAVPPAPPAQVDRVPAGGPEVSLLDLSTLRGYEVKRRWPGALEGLGLGIVAGALAGAAIGSSMGSDPPCNGMDGCVEGFAASDWALFFGSVGAFAGSVVGPLIGLLVGHTDRYLFSGDGAGP